MERMKVDMHEVGPEKCGQTPSRRGGVGRHHDCDARVGDHLFGPLGRGSDTVTRSMMTLCCRDGKPGRRLMWPTQPGRHTMRHGRAAPDTHPKMVRQHDLRLLRLRYERRDIPPHRQDRIGACASHFRSCSGTQGNATLWAGLEEVPVRESKPRANEAAGRESEITVLGRALFASRPSWPHGRTTCGATDFSPSSHQAVFKGVARTHNRRSLQHARGAQLPPHQRAYLNS